MFKPKLKKFLKRFGFDSTPSPLSLKMSKLKLKKRFLKKFLERFGFGFDPPPPSAKIKLRCFFFTGASLTVALFHL